MTETCACSHARDLHRAEERVCAGQIGKVDLEYECSCDDFTAPPTDVALAVAAALREQTSFIDAGPTDLREWVDEVHGALTKAAQWLADRAAQPVESDEFGIWNSGMRHAANLLDGGDRDTSA